MTKDKFVQCAKSGTMVIIPVVGKEAPTISGLPTIYYDKIGRTRYMIVTSSGVAREVTHRLTEDPKGENEFQKAIRILNDVGCVVIDMRKGAVWCPTKKPS